MRSGCRTGRSSVVARPRELLDACPSTSSATIRSILPRSPMCSLPPGRGNARARKSRWPASTSAASRSRCGRGRSSFAMGLEYRDESYRTIGDPYGNGIYPDSPNTDDYPADPLMNTVVRQQLVRRQLSQRQRLLQRQRSLSGDEPAVPGFGLGWAMPTSISPSGKPNTARREA